MRVYSITNLSASCRSIGMVSLKPHESCNIREDNYNKHKNGLLRWVNKGLITLKEIPQHEVTLNQPNIESEIPDKIIDLRASAKEEQPNEIIDLRTKPEPTPELEPEPEPTPEPEPEPETTPEPKPEPKPFYCELCDKQFKNQRALDMHIRSSKKHKQPKAKKEDLITI